MYYGRFAPSPSGRLHFGSLFTGLAATLRAASLNGYCLTRIEDLDFPRCSPILTPWILQELALLGLFPYSRLYPQAQAQADFDLAVQSHNMSVYHDAIAQLYQDGHAFCCNCTRAELKLHACQCRSKGLKPQSWMPSVSDPVSAPSSTPSMPHSAALQTQFQTKAQTQVRTQAQTGLAISYGSPRVTGTETVREAGAGTEAKTGTETESGSGIGSNTSFAAAAASERLIIRAELQKYLQHYPSFKDGVFGQVEQPHNLPTSLILQRRDGIIAYNLAVVVDDHRQGITEIVRGADLLETTFLQLALYEICGYTPPQFFHIPVMLDEHGHKLSKQNHAPAILGECLPHCCTFQAYQRLNQLTTPALQDIIHQQDELARQAAKLISELIHVPESSVNLLQGDGLDPDYYGQLGLFLCAQLADPAHPNLDVSAALHKLQAKAPCVDAQRGSIELNNTNLNFAAKDYDIDTRYASPLVPAPLAHTDAHPESAPDHSPYPNPEQADGIAKNQNELQAENPAKTMPQVNAPLTPVNTKWQTKVKPEHQAKAQTASQAQVATESLPKEQAKVKPELKQIKHETGTLSAETGGKSEVKFELDPVSVVKTANKPASVAVSVDQDDQAEVKASHGMGARDGFEIDAVPQAKPQDPSPANSQATSSAHAQAAAPTKHAAPANPLDNAATWLELVNLAHHYHELQLSLIREMASNFDEGRLQQLVKR